MRNNQDRTTGSRRVLDEIIMAELFLVEATLESAVAMGRGLRRLNTAAANDELNAALRDTRQEMIEPFSSRLAYFRRILKDDWSRD